MCEDLTYVSLEDGREFGRNFCKNCLWESKVKFEKPSDKEIEEFGKKHPRLSPEEALVFLCIKKLDQPFATDQHWVEACCNGLQKLGYLRRIPGDLQEVFTCGP